MFGRLHLGLISGGDLKHRRPLDSLVGFRGKVLEVSCLFTKRAFLRNDQSCKGKKIKKCNSLLKVKETISRKKVQLNKTIQGKQNTKKCFVCRALSKIVPTLKKSTKQRCFWDTSIPYFPLKADVVVGH